MDKVVTIASDQSILDISLQYYGSIDKVFDAIDSLGLESIMSDPTGKSLTVTSINNTVYQNCLKNSITIGNKTSPTFEIPIPEVINYRITDAGDQRETTVGDTTITN